MFLATRCSGCFAALAAAAIAAAPVSAGAATDDGQAEVNADYVAAAALLRPNIVPKLKNARIIPHWIGSSDEFWYLRDTQSGTEFVVVNAATGGKHPAFDHASVAGALARASGKAVDPQKLPFDEIAFDKDRAHIDVALDGKNYRCAIPAGDCAEDDPHSKPGVIVSPDGRFGMLTRDGNLYVRDLAAGSERALTSDGESDFGYGIYYDGWKAAYIPRERTGEPPAPLESYWSPDSTRFIVSRIDQRHVARYPFIESAPIDGSYRPKLHSVHLPLVGEKPATLEWFVVDVRSGEKRRIEFPYSQLLAMQQDLLAIRKTWWSADNRHLYAVAFGDEMASAYFFDADLETGKVRTVIEERATPRVDLNSTSYNPPNVRVVGDCQEVIWFSQRDGWGHLYLYDGKTGALKNQITRGSWLVRDILHVDEKARRIYFSGGGREPGNPYYRYVYRVNFDGSDLKLLSPEAGDHLVTSPWNDVLAFDGALGYEVLSPSGRYVVYTHAPIDKPPQTYIRSSSTARVIAVIETADASAVLAAGYRPPEEAVFTAADGKSRLWTVIYKPLNFDAGKKYPVIDMQYGSPLTAIVPRNFLTALGGVPGYGNPASTARLGFIVITVDARGTTYRSREFSQANTGRLDTMGLEDHVAAIRQLAAAHSWADAERVGLSGGSYGGWTSLRAMLEFPDFYKVAIAGVPPGTMHTMYADYHWSTFEGRPHYSDGSQWRPEPLQVPENWSSADSNAQAGKLKGKLLIVMGELDENVLPGSTLQFTNALIKANKDFDLLYLPDSNHYESSRPYVTRRMWDYFVKNLQGRAPPAQFDMGAATAAKK
jgi:dipeptidyl-peptidase 4